MHALYTLAELPVDQPMTLIDRRRVIGQRMMISDVTLHPGFEVPAHSHDNEQFVVMLEGRARFTVGEGADAEAFDVVGGQVLCLPPNVPHACTAIERCHILDLFSPPSETTGVDQ